MRKKIVITTFLLWTWLAFWGNALGQETKAPFSKQEILRLLKPTPGSRYEQGDLAGEIALRGIAFPVDEKTLDELRKAGARSFLLEAIQQASKNTPRPQPQQQPAAEASGNAPRPTLQQQSTTEAPAPTEGDQRAARNAALARLPLLEQARNHAEEFLDELPNFIV